MKEIMELHDIAKRYNNKKVIEKTSLVIYANQIVALVGKNGSGKSTLLKIIAGLVQPDHGTINEFIHPIKVGYVPEVTPSEIPFTPDEYLTHMGSISGMDKKKLRQRIDNLLEIFNLQDARKTRITSFSKGMKQKVMIMQAMLEETDILVLDEPLSGLDIKAQNDLEEVMVTLKDKGISIFLTCHETKLLERLVDRILVIEEHQVVQTSSLFNTLSKENKLIFEIPIHKSLEKLFPLVEIQTVSHLNSEINEIVAIIKRENTDIVLIELLKRGASIRQLNPIYKD